MKITSHARRQWHPWFAWFPVRVPSDRFVNGAWVWLEWVERNIETSWKLYR
jgi:hypothetical protein